MKDCEFICAAVDNSGDSLRWCYCNASLETFSNPCNICGGGHIVDLTVVGCSRGSTQRWKLLNGIFRIIGY